MEMEQAIAYFAIYGGAENIDSLDLFEDIDLSVEIHFVQQFSQIEAQLTPGYLLEVPYSEVLMAIARGDGRLSNVFRRAKIGEAVGMRLIDELIALGVVALEHSRQAPLRTHPKHLLKKHLRAYRIEPKIRFVKPFYRFWFGFAAPYQKALLRNDAQAFAENYIKHKEAASSLLFEQLSTLLLTQYLSPKEKVLSQGSFWNHHSEFDILSISEGGRVILGECKYTSRPVTKKELTKLKDKAVQSGIPVDTYALFSRSGFSNELRSIKEENLLLFELEDFYRLL